MMPAGPPPMMQTFDGIGASLWDEMVAAVQLWRFRVDFISH
jgi:hypothetical protein